MREQTEKGLFSVSRANTNNGLRREVLVGAQKAAVCPPLQRVCLWIPHGAYLASPRQRNQRPESWLQAGKTKHWRCDEAASGSELAVH